MAKAILNMEQTGDNLCIFLISNFRHVLNVVCFLLGNSSASEFYMPKFRNTLFDAHTRPWPLCGSLPSTDCFCTLTRPYPVTLLPNGSGYFRAKLFPYNNPTFLKPNSLYTHLPAYEDGTECSETSAYKIQTPGHYPEESIQLVQNYSEIRGLNNSIAHISSVVVIIILHRTLTDLKP